MTSPSIVRVQRLGSYAFVTSEGYALLSLLNRGPNRGKWTLVGGGIDFGESPKAALIREIEEEAGIKVTADPILLDVFSHQHAFEQDDGATQEMHFVGIIHTLELPKRVACKADGDGLSSDGTRWFNLNELRSGQLNDQLNPSVLKVLSLLSDFPARSLAPL